MRQGVCKRRPERGLLILFQTNDAVDDLDRQSDQAAARRAAAAGTGRNREGCTVHGTRHAPALHQELARREIEIASRMRALVVIRERAVALAQDDQLGTAGNGRDPHRDRAVIRDFVELAQRLGLFHAIFQHLSACGAAPNWWPVTLVWEDESRRDRDEGQAQRRETERGTFEMSVTGH